MHYCPRPVRTRRRPIVAVAATALLTLLTSAAFAQNNYLYAVSRDTDRVLAFNPANGAQIGYLQLPTGVSPHDVAVGGDGNLYVTTVLGNTIFRFDGNTGAPLAPITLDFLDTPNGPFPRGPFGMAVRGNNIYFSTFFAGQIRVLDTTTGIVNPTPFVSGIGAGFIAGEQASEFAGPTGITFDAAGNLFVSRLNQNREFPVDNTNRPFENSILRYNTSGSLTATIGPGSPLYVPGFSAINPANGLLYVPSLDTNQILRFNAQSGAFVDAFIGDTGGRPLGLTFDTNGDLIVGFLPPGLPGVAVPGNVKRFDGTTGALKYSITSGDGTTGVRLLKAIPVVTVPEASSAALAAGPLALAAAGSFAARRRRRPARRSTTVA